MTKHKFTHYYLKLKKMKIIKVLSLIVSLILVLDSQAVHFLDAEYETLIEKFITIFKEKIDKAMRDDGKIDYKDILFREYEFSDNRYNELAQINFDSLLFKFTREDFKDYKKKAENNDHNAQNILGLFYLSGHKTQENTNKGLFWLWIAACQGYEKACLNLACFYLKTKDLDTKRRCLGFKFLKMMADLGSKEGQYHLAKLWSERTYLDGSDKEAEVWYIKSAEQGFPPAIFALANFYAYPQDRAANNDEAIKWFKKLADKNHSGALFRLGLFYEELGDHKQALKYYLRAHKQNNADSIIALAQIFIYGKGIEKNYKKGVRFLKHAYKANHPRALYIMSALYENGIGVKKNKSKAKVLFNKAQKKYGTFSQYLMWLGWGDHCELLKVLKI